jgi:hypothetical protein
MSALALWFIKLVYLLVTTKKDDALWLRLQKPKLLQLKPSDYPISTWRIENNEE